MKLTEGIHWLSWNVIGSLEIVIRGKFVKWQISIFRQLWNEDIKLVNHSHNFTSDFDKWIYANHSSNYSEYCNTTDVRTNNCELLFLLEKIQQ